jgi:predicted dehydrogenase
MDRVIRVGLIGAGGISSLHAATLQLAPQIKVIAICDPVESRARDLAQRFGVGEVYSSTGEVFRRTKLDAVHVLTPPQHHVAPAIEALRAGCHVLVEKPLALSSGDCARLRSEADRAGLVCGVNHNVTHLPVIERLIDLIRSRRLGRIDHVQMNYCAPPSFVPLTDPGNYMFQQPGNMIFEFAPHPFSVIRLLMGPVVQAECFASGERTLWNGKRFFDSWQISAVCERGTAGLYISVGKDVLTMWLEVLGQDGTAHLDLLRGTLLVSETSPRRIADPIGEAWSHARESLSAAAANIGHQYSAALGFGASRRRDGFYRSFAAFYSAVVSGTRPREDVSAGMEVVEYCEEAARNLKLARAGREVAANAERG